MRDLVVLGTRQAEYLLVIELLSVVVGRVYDVLVQSSLPSRPRVRIRRIGSEDVFEI